MSEKQIEDNSIHTQKGTSEAKQFRDKSVIGAIYYLVRVIDVIKTPYLFSVL